MTNNTRNLLISSINDFKDFTETKKKQMIQHVKNMLTVHTESINAIGYGYADDYVNAGELFLRYIRIYQK